MAIYTYDNLDSVAACIRDINNAHSTASRISAAAIYCASRYDNPDSIDRAAVGSVAFVMANVAGFFDCDNREDVRAFAIIVNGFFHAFDNGVTAAYLNSKL